MHCAMLGESLRNLVHPNSEQRAVVPKGRVMDELSQLVVPRRTPDQSWVVS